MRNQFFCAASFLLAFVVQPTSLGLRIGVMLIAPDADCAAVLYNALGAGRCVMQSSRLVFLAALPRLLYNHNPFYLISALLVLLGIYRTVPPDASAAGGWLLMGLLCGYTLLLALAAYVIIRIGRVWEDARTILLVLVLLFVALSVGFDRLVLDRPQIGARFLLLGLGFASLISEGVLRGLKIQLTGHYRGPYYLILMLLFGYPVLLGQISISGQGDNMPWFVLLFPVAASLALLTLLPAARRAKRLRPPQGALWVWPWFPWSLFAFLLLAIALRSYSLSLGFESGHAGQSSFQPFFLLPLLLSSVLLLLELGIAGGSSATCNAALAAPLGLFLLALPGQGSNPIAARFLATLSSTLGSPVQWTLVGSAIFYAMAWLRGLRWGEIGLIVCASVLAVVNERTSSLTSFSSPHWPPLGCVAIVELTLGLWRRTSWRAMLAALYGVAALSCSDWGHSPLPPAGFHLWHSAILTVLLLGTVCDDPWARLMRRLAWPLIPLAAALAAWGGEQFSQEMPRWSQSVDLVCLAALALTYWLREPAVWRLVAAMVAMSILTGANVRWLYLSLAASQLAPGLPWLAWGSASLTLALLVSFAKAGLVGRWYHRLRSFRHDARPLVSSAVSNDSG